MLKMFAFAPAVSVFGANIFRKIKNLHESGGDEVFSDRNLKRECSI